MNVVQNITKVEVEIKKLLVEDFKALKTKKEINEDYDKYIEKNSDIIPDYMLPDLKKNFEKWYSTMLKEFYKSYVGGITSTAILVLLQNNGYKIKNNKIGKVELTTTQKKLFTKTDFYTMSEDHVSKEFIKDYEQKFKIKMNSILNKLADVSAVDKNNGSLRNKAEIDLRYATQKEYFKKTGSAKYIIASAHANCSERCSYWQGKIFIKDTDLPDRINGKYNPKNPPTPKIVGHVDGKPYYSLAQALDNGFLGYNCRHHLFEYKGQNYRKYEDVQDVLKKRNINDMKRNIERQSRKALTRYEMTDNEVYKNQADKIKDYYVKYCKANKIEPEMWRLKIL